MGLVVRSVLLVMIALPLAAQIISGRYIVELEAEPALSSETKTVARSAAADRLTAVRAGQDGVSRTLAARGIDVRATTAYVTNTLIIEATDAEAAALVGVSGVRRVHPVRLYRKLLDHAAQLQHVTDAWAAAGGSENAGLGVRIAIIDTGIDATHEGLQDPDVTAPDGYPKVTRGSDIQFTNNKVIVARNYDRNPESSAKDSDGHGTAVAMIAAGRTVSGPRGVITGIAPKAFLGNYKVFPDGEEGAPTDLVLRAIDDAVADGMDVMNLSLGGFPAEDPGTDILVAAIERASSAGVLAIVAGGNLGPENATVASPGTAPSAITVGNAWTDRIFATTVQVEGSAFFSLPAAGSTGTAAVAGVLRDVAAVDPSGLACDDLPTDSLQSAVVLILRGTCLFEQKLLVAQRAGAMAAIVYSHDQEPDAVTMSVGTARLPAVMVSHEAGMALRTRLGNSPELMATVTFDPGPVAVSSSRLNTSSSRGPSVNGSVKPDLLAVGTSVYTAAPGGGNQPAFQIASGTSLAAPMVAGAAAMLKAARPGLTAAEYRSLLIHSAGTFSYDGERPAPVQQAGAGLLHVLSAIRSTVTVAPAMLNFAWTADTSETAARVTVTNLGTADDTFAVAIHPFGDGPAPAVSTDSLTLSAGAAGEVWVRLATTDLPAGGYQGFLTVRSSTSDAQARVPYWLAVPSGTVTSLVMGDRSDTGRRLSRQRIYVRPSDAIGLPVDAEPAAAIVAGSGSVLRVEKSERFPGFYLVEVRLGAELGANTFEISAQGVTRHVTLTAE